MSTSTTRAAMASAVALSVVASASAQDAVQWRVEDGGNGHWYALRTTDGIATFEEATEFAASIGATFMTAASAEEWAHISNVALLGLPPGHYATIGVRQGPSGSEPGGGWTWLDGSDFAIPWAPGSPDETWPNEDWAHAYRYGDGVVRLNDCTNDLANPAYPFRLALEWSADCNNDGLVDYGQIRAGDLADANGNNIPDCCEPGAGACPGDLVRDGRVDGVDLAAVLNNWGLSEGAALNADANCDGVVDGQDLATVLGSWGKCP